MGAQGCPWAVGINQRKGPLAAPQSRLRGILKVGAEPGAQGRGISAGRAKGQLVGPAWEIVVCGVLQSCPHWIESHCSPLCKKQCLLGPGSSQDGLGSEAASGR